MKDVIKGLLSRPQISDILRKIVEANFIGEKNVIIREIDSTRKKKVLDLACGTGIMSEMFSDQEYVGCDINQTSIAYAKRKYNKKFKVANAASSGFKRNSFNHILVCGLFHHLSNRDSIAVLKEKKRIATRDCLIVIMEDVPTVSKFNFVGKILHKIDQGDFIRTPKDYIDLFERFFVVKNDYYMRSGFCDYHVFILCNE